MNLSEAITRHTEHVRYVMTLQDDRGKQPLKGIQPDLWAEPIASTSLVLPFIKDVLGYDIFDPAQVIAEYPADLKYKTGDKISGPPKKVDYALMGNTEPLVIVECKSRGDYPNKDFEDKKALNDLSDYFHAAQPAVALHSNGIKHIFYSDCVIEGTRDTKPFLVVDFGRQLTNEIVEDLTTFVGCLRSNPTRDALRECACRIKLGHVR